MTAVQTKTLCMARKKTAEKKNEKTDNHRPRVMVGLPEVLADSLQKQADSEFKSLTALVVEICRTHAEQKGLLPKLKTEQVD